MVYAKALQGLSAKMFIERFLSIVDLVDPVFLKKGMEIGTKSFEEGAPNGRKPRGTVQCKGSNRFQSAEGGRTDEFSRI